MRVIPIWFSYKTIKQGWPARRTFGGNLDKSDEIDCPAAYPATVG